MLTDVGCSLIYGRSMPNWSHMARTVVRGSS
ncbi:MAG: hypothetical protein QOJ69_2057, partial [Actinomycetota bacterium]|nr:hypothetical protein [Actinomycetota bacterium]